MKPPIVPRPRPVIEDPEPPPEPLAQSPQDSRNESPATPSSPPHAANDSRATGAVPSSAPNTALLRYRGREVPGDLPALLGEFPNGINLAIKLAQTGGILTTRHLLAILEPDLRYIPGMGSRAPALAEYIRNRWLIPVGCLAPTFDHPSDLAAWDRVIDVRKPPPSAAELEPHQVDALKRVGGATGVRQAFTGNLPKLRAQFLTFCRGAS